MEYYNGDSYDIAVIGAGHAGVEAALAAARLGMHTILFTISLDAVANMPCNPSIGGTAKGHLVREIDALGGEMGKAADKTFLQSRMLNRGKGPAVHSLRVQADRMAYHNLMKKTVEQQPNLDLKQAEVVELRTDGSGRISAVVTSLGAVHPVKSAVIATGTFLKGIVYVGDVSYPSGPDGLHPAGPLSDSLRGLGIHLRRFKTGTPARVHRGSIDFSQLEEQAGDEPVTPFSFETTEELHNRVVCHIAYTNEETHRVIRENIHRSPLYGGKIEGVGPRYCPSIEDKVVRFADKPRHQLFVEPMGMDTEEMYLQGMSSSLPEDVQIAFYRTIKGFEQVKVMRNAYAIEYDCVDPLDLKPTLEFKAVRGLYGAGQFNGTSGYEEAAAQGLVAGINAALELLGREQIVLDRAGSYIGTLIDDLVTKGCSDPYRMMTSRSEYRLLLRQDNADERLTPLGHEIGLISEERYERFLEKQRRKAEEIRRLEQTGIAPSEELNRMLVSRETAPVTSGARLADLLRRPQISYADLAPFDPERPELPRAVAEVVEVEIKYEGYIKKQAAAVEQMRRLEEKPLPEGMDYREVRGLRLEAQEKLCRVQPRSIGQASRISGVSPADVSVLLIWLEQRGREDAQ
ncbi:MAG: tRNA uridine-5-carboxymethylaminomethyl(34) synthesis enzyme MnmG [Oscillospiraceae bacterium]|nr:tRNA uridine-5-carboxymethylaminomethyl(34) synthesis enzyme MnmG [Oscillospiraceae bacterium]